LTGKRFEDEEKVQKEVDSWLRSQAEHFYDEGINKLVPRLTK
jgi:hypothetical protein